LVGFLGAAVAWVRLRPAFVRVEGPSMAPTLLPGDRLVTVAGLRPRRGDLIVVRHPDGFEMVKRVSAAPGDEAMPGWTLGPDEWLVLGDNRQASSDSRDFGAVTGDSILAKVIWPRKGRSGPGR
jgi:signal peptidase I